MAFIMDQAYRCPDTGIAGSLPGIVLVHPALDIRRDAGVERSVRTFNDIYVPHDRSFSGPPSPFNA